MAVPLTMGTPCAFSGRFGSLGALAVMVTLIGWVPQVAKPWGVTEAPQPAHVGPGVSGNGGNSQFTAKGVTVVGGALKVPVATNCTWLFCVCPTIGEMDIDCSVRPDVPQLTISKELKVTRERTTR